MAGTADPPPHPPAPAVDRLLGYAGALLGDVELVGDLTFSSKATVARLRVPGGGTVVAKQPRDPVAYLRELEALQLLPESVRPALLACGGGVFVLEDLGPGPSLADLLLGDDPVAAEKGLLAWAATLGQALRATLCEGQGPAPEDLGEGVEELRRLAAELEVPVPAGLDDDVALIASTLAAPGPWLAFCPSDTCPDNNRVLADGSVRLFDFEGARWRHAGLEAAYCRAPFCTCWCVARLPDGMTGRMEEAFLDRLAPADVGAFVDTVGVAAVSYTLESFHWFRRRFVVEDLPPGLARVMPCTGRQYVYERLRSIAALQPQLPALAAVAGGLAARITERWPDAAAMALYPAFRSPRR